MKISQKILYEILNVFIEAPKISTDYREIIEKLSVYSEDEIIFHMQTLNEMGNIERLDARSGIGYSQGADGHETMVILPLKITVLGHKYFDDYVSKNEENNNLELEKGLKMEKEMPKVFIGSSSEGKKIAYSIQKNLADVCHPTVWDQGIFKLSTGILNSLFQSLDKFDFAVFVFSPDDISTIRGNIENTVRDNIIFEVGLFMGRLGSERVFFVKPKTSKLHLPTDLLSITYGDFDDTRSDLGPALAPFCHDVGEIITELGGFSKKKV